MPLAKVPFLVTGGEAVPHYLTEPDHPWLRNLLDEFQAFAGRPRRDLESWLRQCRFLQVAPAKERAATVVHVLFQLVGTRLAEECLPAGTRLELFELAARMDPPDLALAEIGKRLGVAPTDVARGLFADLPEERLLQRVPQELHPRALALAANLAQAQALLRRATFAEILVVQRSRALVRMAQLSGLLCEVKEYSTKGALLEIRGTLARMRDTTRYGHAIGRLLPLLPWCAGTVHVGTVHAGTVHAGTVHGSASTSADTHVTNTVEATPGTVLRARCRLGNQDVWFRVRAEDPLPAAAEPRTFDSQVERRFATDFRCAAPHLELIREPEPIPVDGGFVFPDFRIQDPGDPHHSCLLEIIGFWTEDYLRKKLAGLRSLARAAAAGRGDGRREEPWILCVDEQRRGMECERPEHMQLVWYRRRIDPEQVLEAWLTAQ